jgi:membrane-bound serine protease (ClpP class)
MRKFTKFILLILDESLIIFFIIYLLHDFNVDASVSIIFVLILVALLIFMLYIFLPQLRQPATGTEGMIGMSGKTIETLNPTGMIKIKGEIWTAESINGKIESGEKIIVKKVNDLTLIVKKTDKEYQ